MWNEHCSYKSSRVHLRTCRPTARGSSRARAKMPASSTSAMARRRLQDGEPQPSDLHRALPGRGDGRRRHPARRVHHGRPARRRPELPALRAPDHRKTAISSPASLPASAATAILRRADGRRRGANSTRATTATSSSTPCRLRRRQTNRIFYGSASGVCSPSSIGSKTGRDGIHGATMASVNFEAKGPAAPHGAGRRSLLGKAAARSVSRNLSNGRVTPSRTWARRASHGRPSKWPPSAGTASSSIWTSVPAAKRGMSAYEMMLSESQERMLHGARSR